MRVKALVVGLKELVEDLGVEGWREFRTPDGTRIDYAITQGSRRLLAIEFERTRKWLFARVLYNSVKAQRAEFPAILFVYPYYDLPRAGRSWVPNYVEDILGLRLALCHPRDCMAATRALIAEQLGLPISSEIQESDSVITTTTQTSNDKPSSLKVGAEAWRQTKTTSRKRTSKKRRITQKKSTEKKTI